MKQLLWIVMGGVVVSMILFGCKGSDGSAGPQGPPGTGLTGNLHGKVSAYDSFGNYLGYLSGVQVTAEGTAYSGTTDSLGAYVLSGLPTGTYTLAFSKVGYGTNKQPQFQFVGGADYYTGSTSIAGLPNFEASTATAAIAAGTLNVTGTVTGGTPPYSRRVYIFFGKTSSVSAAVPSSYVDVYSASIASSANNYALAVSVSSIMSNYGYVSGDTIYLAVYSVSSYTPVYYDYASGKYVYTAVGAVLKSTNVVIP